MQTNKKTITWRLLGGIIVVTLLLSVFSAMAILGTQEHHDAAMRLYSKHVTATVQLSTANDRLWRLRYGFPQYLVFDAAGRERIEKEEPILDAEIRKILLEYSGLQISAGEREQLAQVEASYKRYMAARPEWFALVNAGRLKEAAEYRARTTTPWGQETVDAFIQLMQIQQENAREESATMIENAKQHQRLAIGLTIIMLALLAPLLLGVIRIMRTLREAQDVAIDAATNVFKEPILVAGRDELDALVTTIHLTSARFVAHTNELESARNELSRQRDSMEREVFERTVELQNALVHMEQQADQATRLTDLNDRLQNCQNQDEAMHVIAAFGPALFPNTPGALALINASRNLVSTFSTWKYPADEKESLFEPDACWALRRNRAHYSNAECHDVQCSHVHGRSTLCIPLHNQDGALGVLTLLLEETAMSRQDVEQLAIRFANQVALAITNLRLREKLREQSILDSLTTLYNRRYFEETLNREIARADRNDSPLTLMVLDVDHFKRFNDTYGHEAGDRILNLVGRTIKSSIRPSDIGCRYGGEEFVVVMPDASSEATPPRADALRRDITQAVSEINQGQFGQVTVSMGIAYYPAHGKDGTSLFVAADKALYEAKRLGRNRVEVAGIL